jgi:hypothetical protein
VCFIGTPLIDFKLCNEMLYKDLLLSAKQKYGDFKYYLHPDEQITLLFKIKGIEFIKLTADHVTSAQLKRNRYNRML